MSAATAETVQAPAATHEEERWHPSAAGWAVRFALLAAILGGIIWYTVVAPGFWAFHISEAAIWAIIGLSLNIVLGYTGQVSLGHHAFVGIAAFVAAYYVTEQAGCTEESCALGSFGIALLLAVLSGAISAGILGIVALRIKGLYLALITLAYGSMAVDSIFEIDTLTRGSAGMPAPQPKPFDTDNSFALLCFVFLALVILIDWRLVRSKVGRAILAVKNSEAVAASYGVNVTAYKIMAFVVSGMFAGLAGALLAFRLENVVSNNFQFATGLLWVLMVVVGGLGNRTGVVIGSAFFALFPPLIELINPLEHWLVESLDREIGYLQILVGAMLAVITIVLFPGGLAEQLGPVLKWFRGHKFEGHHHGGGHHEEKSTPKKSLMERLGLAKHSSDGEGPDEPGAIDPGATSDQPVVERDSEEEATHT